MGGFSSTSTNLSLAGPVLHAQCKKADGTVDQSQIDTNPLIGNNNGAFDRSGSQWFDTSINPRLVGSTLEADLLGEDGHHHFSQIDLNNFISNNDGILGV